MIIEYDTVSSAVANSATVPVRIWVIAGWEHDADAWYVAHFLLMFWCLLAAFGMLLRLGHPFGLPSGTLVAQGSMFDDFCWSSGRKVARRLGSMFELFGT